MEIQKKEEAKQNKLHLSISNDRINRNGSNMVIGVGDSVERGETKPNDQDDDEESQDNNRELFSGLLGNGEEDALAVKERKREEKKKLVDKLTVARA